MAAHTTIKKVKNKTERSESFFMTESFSTDIRAYGDSRMRLARNSSVFRTRILERQGLFAFDTDLYPVRRKPARSRSSQPAAIFTDSLHFPDKLQRKCAAPSAIL